MPDRGAAAGQSGSAEETSRVTLERLEHVDASVKAFTAVDPERVLADARALDARLARGDAAGPLAGVSVAVKDLIDVEGLPSSYGTSAIPARIATSDATCVARLRAAGALIVGKTRTSELAWRGDTPPTENPRYPGLIPGGSSGGSAAAVAAGLVRVGLGTDTGGSIRWPAAMCGLVGLKPTYGAVSLAGVLPCSWALDHVGQITDSVGDARAVLGTLAGHDARDPASAPARLVDPLRARLASHGQAELRGRRLGVIDEPLFEIADTSAASAFERVLGLLAAEGAEIHRVGLPEARFAAPAITAISLADGVLFAGALRERPRELCEDVRQQLQLAQALPAALVVRARQVRRLLVRRVADLFRAFLLDAVIAPAATGPPLARERLDVKVTLEDGAVESALGWSARTFYLANLTGQPALVVPIASQARPLAVQLIGRPFADDRLLDLGALLEQLLR